MRKPKHFYVYIMTNNQRFHVLYTGITGDLPHRVFEHKHKLTPGFTSKYNLTRLVYCEMFNYPGDAIQRERKSRAGSAAKRSS
jgi:putative endonuclease